MHLHSCTFSATIIPALITLTCCICVIDGALRAAVGKMSNTRRKGTALHISSSSELQIMPDLNTLFLMHHSKGQIWFLITMLSKVHVTFPPSIFLHDSPLLASEVSLSMLLNLLSYPCWWNLFLDQLIGDLEVLRPLSSINSEWCSILLLMSGSAGTVQHLTALQGIPCAVLDFPSWILFLLGRYDWNAAHQSQLLF